MVIVIAVLMRSMILVSSVVTIIFMHYTMPMEIYMIVVDLVLIIQEQRVVVQMKTMFIIWSLKVVVMRNMFMTLMLKHAAMMILWSTTLNTAMEGNAVEMGVTGVMILLNSSVVMASVAGEQEMWSSKTCSTWTTTSVVPMSLSSSPQALITMTTSVVMNQQLMGKSRYTLTLILVVTAPQQLLRRRNVVKIPMCTTQ